MSEDISVVLCAHNPRPAFLAPVFQALQKQTLPRTDWELLVIDNASAQLMRGDNTAAWHPCVGLLLEPTLGLSRARIRKLR